MTENPYLSRVLAGSILLPRLQARLVLFLGILHAAGTAVFHFAEIQRFRIPCIWYA